MHCSSPVWCSACVPRWALRHTLSTVDDEAVKFRKVDFGAKLCIDAAPPFKLVGVRRTVSHTPPLVVVMHTCSTCCVTVRGYAAAQTLRVAALSIRCTRSPRTLLWTLWWRHREKKGKLATLKTEKKPSNVF